MEERNANAVACLIMKLHITIPVSTLKMLELLKLMISACAFPHDTAEGNLFTRIHGNQSYMGMPVKPIVVTLGLEVVKPINLQKKLKAPSAPFVSGQPYDYPMANLSTRWVNNAAMLKHNSYTDGSAVRAIVLRSQKQLPGISFAAGFFCAPPCQSFLFAVFIVYTNSGAGITLSVNGMAQVIWSANRASLVGENATIELTGDGNLVLHEANGRLVWSSNTSVQLVAGMEITEHGNLVLFDQRNATVWQSFDHPTDVLVPGQSLLQGMKLRANTSTTNWTESKLYMTVLPDGLYGYVGSKPPQLYYTYLVDTNKSRKDPTRVTFTNGSLNIFLQSTQAGKPEAIIALPEAKSIQYIRLEYDGHLRLYEWSDEKWTMCAESTGYVQVDNASVLFRLILVQPNYCKCEKQRGLQARLLEELLLQGCNVQKLGEGGFGSVFEGKISEERVAVKCLESARQGNKEFLAEVETIGSIEHINLVRLIGFCVEKSNRILVYEYMPRGSLDKWIYYRHNNTPLDWNTRCRIILDIAKGLCYLHEECRRKIAHLDIKPQNILLDENFNAKLADFGLSKLMDRDQSKVMTVMRGTPGYLAPEWLTSQITEKVDVYSFGVVLMEIISGRKNIDFSQPEESVQLIKLLCEKAQNNQLIDMVDKHSNDMISRQEEVIQMMKLAMWCLQNDSCQRPSMSMVVKSCLLKAIHRYILLHLLHQYYLVQDEMGG
uniref:non-specific serine/threonine protein kinase n=1 Tax=Oryza sativa subsp. japonica TaxID=39947 RepID=Q7XMC2_ORYSJ|nr:OSJNBb0018A10.13 [Oryza sativa Japonica Group]